MLEGLIDTREKALNMFHSFRKDFYRHFTLTDELASDISLCVEAIKIDAWAIDLFKEPVLSSKEIFLQTIQKDYGRYRAFNLRASLKTSCNIRPNMI